MKQHYLTLVVSLLLISGIFAQNCPPNELTTGQYLQANRYRAYIDANPLTFDQGNDAFLTYEPEGSDRASTIFAQNLWLSFNDNDTIGAAVGTYSPTLSGYLPGPLSEDGQPFENACVDFNRTWSVRSYEVEAYLQDFNDNGVIDDPIPAIMGWPGTGNPDFAEYNGFELPETTQPLAPFFDANGDAIYDPNDGDYPVGPGNTGIPSQLIWAVTNTVALPTTLATTFPAEVQITAYAYECSNNSLLNDQMFMSYRVTYHGEEVKPNVRIGLWQDFDLGCFEDDYFGVDSSSNTVYAYNEDPIDGSSGTTCVTGLSTFGGNPPVQSITFLNQPLSSFVLNVGFNGPSGTLSPTTPQEFYNVLDGRWRDGSIIRAADDGYDEPSTVPPTKFMFHDYPNDPQGWSLFTEALGTTDRRGVAAFAKDEILPGEVVTIDLAYGFHQAEGNDHLSNVTTMANNVAEIQAIYDAGLDAETCNAITCDPATDCVYPGDLNADGTANYIDLIALGFGIGETGPDRNTAIVWAPRPGDDWGGNQVIGPENKHLDGNGDGLVSDLDFFITRDFYNLTRPDYQAPEDVFVDGPDIQFVRGSNREELIFIDPGELITNGRVSLFTAEEDLRAISFEFAYDTAFLDVQFIDNIAPDEFNYIRETAPGNYEYAIYAEEGELPANEIQQLIRLLMTVKDGPIADFPDFETTIDIYNIRAWQNDGTEVTLGSISTRLRFTDAPSSVNEPAWATRVNVFPNPATNRLNIRQAASDIRHIQVFDALGQQVMDLPYNNSISLAQLTSGTYFLRLIGQDGTATRKFTKR